jgi:hypothetical protein
VQFKLPFYLSSLAIAVAVGAGLSTFTPTSNAVVSTPTLSGSCGIAMYMSRKGVTPSDGDALDGMGVINFDNKTIVGTINILDSSKPKGARLDNLSWEFEVSAGRFEGAALISQKAGTAGDFPTIQVLPVNGKNTYLIQFVDDDTVGVCQKI